MAGTRGECLDGRPGGRLLGGREEVPSLDAPELTAQPPQRRDPAAGLGRDVLW
jgi:hypothetical protein